MLFRVLSVATALAFSLNLCSSEAYNRVSVMFAEGTIFDFSSKLGWHSGRCFSPNSETALAAIVILDSRSANGPAFPGLNKFIIFTSATPRSPDVYDNPSAADRVSLASTFESLWPSIVPMEETTAYSMFYSTVMHSLRLSKDNLFLVGDASSLVSADRLSCYFFKRVD